MSNVTCQHCNNEVVPRLWHYSPSLIGRFTNVRTQHMCPFCGAVMYETGGGLTVFGKCVLIFVIAFLHPFIPDFGSLGNSVVSLVVAVLFLYLVFSMVRHLWRSSKRRWNTILGRRS